MSALNDDAVFRADSDLGKTLATVGGCMDRFCYLTGPRSGQVTNGGCRCVTDQRARQVLLAFHRLRSALHLADTKP